MRKVLFAVLLLSACSSCHPEPSPVVPPKPTPVVVDAGLDPCASACANGRAHACAWAKETDQGVSCEAWCRDDRSKPAAQLTDAYLHCLATLTACDVERSCPR